MSQTYTCEHCQKKHSNEFSRTCKTCDQDRESGDLDLDAKLKVGDTVLWRGNFGRSPAIEAVVEGIELVEVGEKYGTPTESAPWSRLTGRHAVISFGSHWAYAEQIDKLSEGA